MATAADVENEQFRTMKDFMKNYNKLSEICFADCIWDFTTRWTFKYFLFYKLINQFIRKISGIENQCAMNCAEKYLKMNQRISSRFQEFQMMSNENAMAVIKNSGQLWYLVNYSMINLVTLIYLWHSHYFQDDVMEKDISISSNWRVVNGGELTVIHTTEEEEEVDFNKISPESCVQLSSSNSLEEEVERGEIVIDGNLDKCSWLSDCPRQVWNPRKKSSWFIFTGGKSLEEFNICTVRLGTLLKN